MNLFTLGKNFHLHVTKNYLKHRAVPLAALVLTTAMTFPVIAVGMDEYTITDGNTTEVVSMYQGDAEAALQRSTFSEEDYSIASLIETEEGYED